MHSGKWLSFGVLARGPGSLSQVEIGTTVMSRLWMVGRHVVTWEEHGALKSGRLGLVFLGGLSCPVFLRKPELLFPALCSGRTVQWIQALREMI